MLAETLPASLDRIKLCKTARLLGPSIRSTPGSDARRSLLAATTAMQSAIGTIDTTELNGDHTANVNGQLKAPGRGRPVGIARLKKPVNASACSALRSQTGWITRYRGHG